MDRHGVKQPRNPWTDGPSYITQCPIQPGRKFTQRLIFTFEEGTIWWHAHSEWLRATVYGAIYIYPNKNTPYPFPQPDAEIPIIFGMENILNLHSFDQIIRIFFILPKSGIVTRHDGRD